MANDRDAPSTPPAPGWYPDPWSATGTGERYFDGKRWLGTERPIARRRLTGLDAARGAAPPARSRRVRLPWRGPRTVEARPWVTVVVLVAMVGGLYWLRTASRSPGNAASLGTPAGTAGRPPPGAGESGHRLLAAVKPRPGLGGFQFMAHEPGRPNTPVTFDPCRPVHYVVDPAGAPPDGLALVQSAIASVSAATGLKFVYDGSTTEAPDKQRAPYQPARYGTRRWAPVLIAWSDEAAYPSLSGYVAGVAGPETMRMPDGTLVYVSGQVVLDSVQLSDAQAPDRDFVRAVILHELGHLVGLDHVADTTQLMYSEATFGVRAYGDGDRRGLALLGRGPCEPNL